MIIAIERKHGKWRAEVWSEQGGLANPTPDDDSTYTQINEWCIQSFGYHARSAYHIFDFKKQAELEWFVLRWGGTDEN